MSVSVKFGKSNDAPNKLHKTFTAVVETSCILKDNCDVITPTFLVTQSLTTLKDCNYMNAFGKYYFIDNIISVNNSCVEVSGHVDVLKTYESYIDGCYGTLKRTSIPQYYDRMLSDDKYPYTENKLTACRKFQTGLSGESFILLLTGIQTSDA